MDYAVNGNDDFYTCYDSSVEIIKAKAANSAKWTCKRRGIARNSTIGLFTAVNSLEWSDELGYSASSFVEENLGCNTYINNLQYDLSAKELVFSGPGDRKYIDQVANYDDHI